MTDPGQPGPLAETIPAPADVFSLAFSPDSRTLAAGTSGQITAFWDMEPVNNLLRAPLLAACARGAGPMELATWELNAPGIPFKDPCA